MRRARILPAALTLFTLIGAFSIASLAHAESVQDTQVIPYTLAEPGDEIGRPGQCWATMTPGTQVTVTYNVRATNATTGEPACGTSVPVGTPLRFEFLPHVSQDIVWSATGYSLGTPYGSWAVNGNYSRWNSGTKNRCVSPNWYHTIANAHGGYVQLYADLAMATPAQTITVDNSNLNCAAADSNGNRTCTAEQSGDSVATFNIGQTSGLFYPGQVQTGTSVRPSQVQQCDAGFVSPMRRNGSEITNTSQTIVWGGCYSTSPYNVVVKAKIISCPITITDAAGEPPSAPTVAAAGAACIVGQPHALTMTATDPDGDNIRYGIDWDANGTLDQFVPADGYVPSGTSQTASRTYSITGAKTVKVLVQDENGLTSNWATVSFDCAGSTTAGLNEADATDDGGDLTFLTPVPNLDLRVIPSLLRSGKTTKVNWSATGVSSCTVAGQNGDAWSGLLSAIGGNISKPITGETIYTLSCIDLSGTTQTKSATVRIIPTFQEI